MKNVLLILIAMLVANASAIESNKTVWSVYGQNQKIVRKNFSDLDFSSVIKDQELVTANVDHVIEYTTMLSPENEAKFNQWILSTLNKNKISVAAVSNLSIDQTFQLVFKVVSESIQYCPGANAEKYTLTDQFSNLESMTGLEYRSKYNAIRLQNVLNRQGVCDEYSWLTTKTFDWMQKRNALLKNVRIISTAKPEIDHGWNIVLIFYPDHLTYSHIDLVASGDEKFGAFNEGVVGTHFSENEDYNLGFLYEQIEEYQASYGLYKNFYIWQTNHGIILSADDKIKKLYRMTFLARKSSDYESAYKYAMLLNELTTERYALESKAMIAMELKKYSVSYYLYKTLFLEGVNRSIKTQLSYLDNIAVCLIEMKNIEQFKPFVKTAYKRALTIENDKFLVDVISSIHRDKNENSNYIDWVNDLKNQNDIVNSK